MKLFFNFFPLATWFPEWILKQMTDKKFLPFKEGKKLIYPYKEDGSYTEIVNGEYIIYVQESRTKTNLWLAELTVLVTNYNWKEIEFVLKGIVNVHKRFTTVGPDGLNKELMSYSFANNKKL